VQEEVRIEMLSVEHLNRTCVPLANLKAKP
jgi:hypothetical protein